MRDATRVLLLVLSLGLASSGCSTATRYFCHPAVMEQPVPPGKARIHMTWDFSGGLTSRLTLMELSPTQTATHVVCLLNGGWSFRDAWYTNDALVLDCPQLIFETDKYEKRGVFPCNVFLVQGSENYLRKLVKTPGVELTGWVRKFGGGKVYASFPCNIFAYCTRPAFESTACAAVLRVNVLGTIGSHGTLAWDRNPGRMEVKCLFPGTGGPSWIDSDLLTQDVEAGKTYWYTISRTGFGGFGKNTLMFHFKLDKVE